MKPKRHTLPLTLTCLILAGGAAAQIAPGYPELFDQASNTYEKGDWVHCREQFAAAAKAAPLDRQAARALSGAARCAARAGDKDGAFRDLDQAAARGYRDADRIATDSDFDHLRQPEASPVQMSQLRGIRSQRRAQPAQQAHHSRIRRLVSHGPSPFSPEGFNGAVIGAGCIRYQEGRCPVNAHTVHLTPALVKGFL